jgi:hypothetical protein
VDVDVVGNTEIIADATRNGMPQSLIDMYQANQLRGEGEALLRGRIGPNAITTTMPPSLQGGSALVLMRGSQALTVLGGVGTTVRLGSSIDQSFTAGSPMPFGTQVVREAGGWTGAWLGAQSGTLIGAGFGIESGPGAIATGIVGGIVGGFMGYFAGDEVVSP